MWTGVDLDGTLAESPSPHGAADHIGAPVIPMLMRVKEWLRQGREVRILTARAYPPGDASAYQVDLVKAWCRKYVGRTLPVTCMKDHDMDVLYDDRAVQVIHNTGELVK